MEDTLQAVTCCLHSAEAGAPDGNTSKAATNHLALMGQTGAQCRACLWSPPQSPAGMEGTLIGPHNDITAGTSGCMAPNVLNVPPVIACALKVNLKGQSTMVW